VGRSSRSAVVAAAEPLEKRRASTGAAMRTTACEPPVVRALPFGAIADRAKELAEQCTARRAMLYTPMFSIARTRYCACRSSAAVVHLYMCVWQPVVRPSLPRLLVRLRGARVRLAIGRGGRARSCSCPPVTLFRVPVARWCGALVCALLVCACLRDCVLYNLQGWALALGLIGP